MILTNIFNMAKKKIIVEEVEEVEEVVAENKVCSNCEDSGRFCNVCSSKEVV